MKKLLFLLVIALGFVFNINAQQKTSASKDSTKQEKVKSPIVKHYLPKKDWSKVDLTKRPADHFVFQYGFDGWAGKPDSIRTKGFSRHFNFYAMLDKPIKKNPHYSLDYGLGFGTSNIFFDRVNVNLAGTGSTLPFTDVSNSDHFNKMKLTTIYLELPVELRYYENPENKNTGWKAALGVKLGTLFKAYTKGKNYESAAGGTYYGSTFIRKDTNKRFINGSKVALTGRIGYGNFSLHGDFNVLGVIKDGFGPVVNAYSIGISIGGL